MKARTVEPEPFGNRHKMQVLSIEDAMTRLRKKLPPTARVYAPGCAGEPTAFVEAMRAQPSLAAGLTFLGVWIPGVNAINYAGLHPDARAETIFMAPPLRDGFEQGDVDVHPLSYTQAYPWLETTPLDGALFQVSPPDPDGMVSLGVSADFSPAVWARDGVVKAAHINPAMPRPATAPTAHISSFDIICTREATLLRYAPSTLSEVYGTIAENIATLINDRDVLQFGLGNVQLATLRALHGKRDLRIHSGMISDPVLDAIDAGALSTERGAITTGVALGTDALYEFCGHDPRIRFAPVCETHAIATVGAIDNFVAINSVIEVDLFGQANAEYIGAKNISGAGGLVDFLRGAAISKGGKPIVALAATAKGGAHSRIVPKLNVPSVSIPRADMGFVVTEHGVADLRGLSVEARAAALIAIADPRHREDLARSWQKLKDAL